MVDTSSLFSTTPGVLVCSGDTGGGQLIIQLPAFGLVWRSSDREPLRPPMRWGARLVQGKLKFGTMQDLIRGDISVTTVLEEGCMMVILKDVAGRLLGVFTPEEGVTVPFESIATQLSPPDEWEEPTQLNTLQVLKGTERLGGIAGYEKYLSQPPHATPVQTPSADLRSMEKAVAATFKLASLLAYTWASISTFDGYVGEMHCWGPGVAIGSVVGVLNFDSWDVLTSKTNTFHIAGGGKEYGGVLVSFVIDGNVEATFVAGGSVLGAVIGLNGVCDWTKSAPEKT